MLPVRDNCKLSTFRFLGSFVEPTPSDAYEEQRVIERGATSHCGQTAEYLKVADIS
jgi:hypothetical protein